MAGKWAIIIAIEEPARLRHKAEYGREQVCYIKAGDNARNKVGIIMRNKGIAVDKLINDAKDIVKMCDKHILEGTKNEFEINVIKREFMEQIDAISNQGKALVLNKRREIYAWRIIVDSADFNFDKDLFEKVFWFGKACEKLKKHLIIIKYPNR